MSTGRSGYEIRSASWYQILWKSAKPLWNSRSCSIFKTTTICHFEISKVGRFVLRAVAPKISCWSAEAAVGQRDVMLTCWVVVLGGRSGSARRDADVLAGRSTQPHVSVLDRQSVVVLGIDLGLAR